MRTSSSREGGYNTVAVDMLLTLIRGLGQRQAG